MNKYQLFIFCFLLTPIAFSAEIIVSAGDPETSSTGRWHHASGATMPYERNRGMYSSTSYATSTYTFTPVLPESTEYRVDVYNSCYAPRSHQVRHIIHHAGGVTEHVLEQDCRDDPYVGQWRTLGTYYFDEGTSGSLVIDTGGSNNRYIGATAVRFLSDTDVIPGNTPPTLEPSNADLSVNEGEFVSVTAMAADAEDGNISEYIQWNSSVKNGTGETFSFIAGQNDFMINLRVTDEAGAEVTSTISVNVTPVPIENDVNTVALHNFDCTVLESLPASFITNNRSALPNVGVRCGRYTAELTDNANNRTLHYRDFQGRFDGVVVSFPFRVIARNVGIAPMGDATSNHPQGGQAYLFAGMQVQHINFNSINSAHLVVGQRGSVTNTIEAKTTADSRSVVNDIGRNRLPDGRADLMIVGEANGDLTAFWQTPNTTNITSNDNWILYGAQGNADGKFPGNIPDWGGNRVYVGLITYAQNTAGLPFMGVADSFQIGE